MNKHNLMKKRKKFAACMLAAMVMALCAGLKSMPAYADGFTDAVSIPADGVWSDKYLLAEGTTDYYKFTIAKAGETDIKLMSYTVNLTYTLYDSNFKGIKSKNLHDGTDTSPYTESIVQWLSQGTYYVSVSQQFQKGGGNYRLCTSFSSSGITAADSDSYDSPQAMRLNNKVTGALTNSNQEDWYKVAIPYSGIYKETLQCSNNYFNYCLYNETLSELDKMNTWNTNPVSDTIELKPGTYYIKIEGIKVTQNNGGKYTFQLSEAIPRKGEILTKKNQAQYKVTKAGRSGGTVTYQKPIDNMKASITIPATVKIDYITYKVTGIASNAFKGNSLLKKVTIGKNVGSIGTNAFSACAKLKSITVPASVKSIGKQAFYKCSNLKTITIKSTKLTSSKVGANAWKGIHKKATIKVPKSKFKTYKSIFKKKGAGAKAKYRKFS